MSKRTRSEQMASLVDKFALSVIEQVEQIHHGTASRGNRAAKRYMAAVDKLFGVYGDEGREALKQLLCHHNDRVRGLSAAYLLRYSTTDSMEVLKEVAKNGKGLLRYAPSTASRIGKREHGRLIPRRSLRMRMVGITEMTDEGMRAIGLRALGRVMEGFLP